MKRFFQHFAGSDKNKYVETEERVDVTKEFGSTILHYACANNIEDMAKDILASSIDVNIVDSFGFTPLHLACDRGATNIVRMLLRAGANTEIQTTKGETALYIACDKDNVEIVRILLRYGADALTRTVREDTPLNVACRNRNIGIVRLLLDNGAVSKEYGRVDNTPLRYACEAGDLDIAELLLERMPQLSIDKALHWACESKNYYLIKALLDRGANINAVNVFGQTPLRVACNERMYSAVRLFVARKADVNIADMFGVTPLRAVVRSFREMSLIQLVDMFEIVRLLIDNFADLSALPKKKDDKLVSILLGDLNARIRTRVALHVQDIDLLRQGLTSYYNLYKPEYNNALRMDLSNLYTVSNNLERLEEMRCFVEKLKISKDYVRLKQKLDTLLDDKDAETGEIEHIRELLLEVNKFGRNVNTLRNTKVIESVVLPVVRARNKCFKGDDKFLGE